MSAPNRLIDLVDYRTGELIETQAIFDAGQRWAWGRDGWSIISQSGCGRPMPEWLAESPRPPEAA